MTAIVVLGMHRSGTSLVSSMLHTLGVTMGANGFLEADEGNPHGYWEDGEFLDINKRLLKRAGGDWRNPPSVNDIEKLKKDKEVSKVCRQLVNSRHGVWGWKDPRTCLTLPVWWQFLDRHDTRILMVKRHKGDVLQSLTSLHGTGVWGKLYDIYVERINSFVSAEHPKIGYVLFTDLLQNNKVVVEWLAEFAGIAADTNLISAARRKVIR